MFSILVVVCFNLFQTLILSAGYHTTLIAHLAAFIDFSTVHKLTLKSGSLTIL